MNLPNFIGIGAQKGGSTYLHGLLKEHSQVFLANPKEIHFFSLNYSKGIDWYSNYFLGSGSFSLRGEFTPYYLYHPLSAHRIYEALPAAKLIVLLRDPVERAISQYFHSQRLGLESIGIEEAFEMENHRLEGSYSVLESGLMHYSHQHHSYLSRSRYEVQLSAYEHLFSTEQLLVLPSEMLFRNVEHAWAMILKFLELDAVPVPANVSQYQGSKNPDAVTPEFNQILRTRLESTYQAIMEKYGAVFFDYWS